MEKIASTAPAAPSRCPVADLVDDIATLFARVAEHQLDRLQLQVVAQRRRGAVRVHVLDLGPAAMPPLRSAARIERTAPSWPSAGAVMW